MPLIAVSPREMEQIFYQLIQWVVDAAGDGAGHKLVYHLLGIGWTNRAGVLKYLRRESAATIRWPESDRPEWD